MSSPTPRSTGCSTITTEDAMNETNGTRDAPRGDEQPSTRFPKYEMDHSRTPRALSVELPRDGAHERRRVRPRVIKVAHHRPPVIDGDRVVPPASRNHRRLPRFEREHDGARLGPKFRRGDARAAREIQRVHRRLRRLRLALDDAERRSVVRRATHEQFPTDHLCEPRVRLPGVLMHTRDRPGGTDEHLSERRVQTIRRRLRRTRGRAR